MALLHLGDATNGVGGATVHRQRGLQGMADDGEAKPEIGAAAALGAHRCRGRGRGGGLAQTVGARTPGDAWPVDGSLARTGGGGRRRAPARTLVETERE